jgi:hypothetical protein
MYVKHIMNPITQGLISGISFLNGFAVGSAVATKTDDNMVIGGTTLSAGVVSSIVLTAIGNKLDEKYVKKQEQETVNEVLDMTFGVENLRNLENADYDDEDEEDVFLSDMFTSDDSDDEDDEEDADEEEEAETESDEPEEPQKNEEQKQEEPEEKVLKLQPPRTKAEKVAQRDAKKAKMNQAKPRKKYTIPEEELLAGEN